MLVIAKVIKINTEFINYYREIDIDKVNEDVELPSIQRRVKAIKGQVKAPEICKPYNQIHFSD